MQNRLRVIRAELGMSQDALARLSGLSRATVNRIEKGHYIPTGNTMMKISRASSLHLHFLIACSRIRESPARA